MVCAAETYTYFGGEVGTGNGSCVPVDSNGVCEGSNGTLVGNNINYKCDGAFSISNLALIFLLILSIILFFHIYALIYTDLLKSLPRKMYKLWYPGLQYRLDDESSAMYGVSPRLCHLERAMHRELSRWHVLIVK